MNTKEEIDKLVNENIGLVGFVLKKYFYVDIAIHPYLKEDMYQEGSIGLFQAARSFDKNRGVKFSTLATRAIKCKIINFKVRYIQKHYNNKISSLDKEDNEGLKVLDLLSQINVLSEEQEEGYIQELLKELTSSEKEVLKWTLKGLPQRAIAKKIGKSQVTVSRYSSSIKNKLRITAGEKEGTNQSSYKDITSKVYELREKGYKFREIAEYLGIPSGSVGYILNKSKINAKGA